MIGSLGELLVEFICTEQDGRNLRPAAYVGPFPSGAPGIFIDQAARVGGAAVFAGAVGSDAFGQVLRDRLTASGVSGDLIRTVPGVPTGTAHVSYNSDGSRDFVFNMAHSAAARFPDGERGGRGFPCGGRRCPAHLRLLPRRPRHAGADRGRGATAGGCGRGAVHRPEHPPGNDVG